MHDQSQNQLPPPPPPSKANPYPIFIAAVLASALSLAYSTAKAQEPSQFKRHQISMMLGSGDFDTDLGSGTTDNVSPISLGYGFNVTERHGIWVQLTPPTEFEEDPDAQGTYDSIQILYKATFPTAKENIKPYALVGFSNLAWEIDYSRQFIEASKAAGLDLERGGSGLGLAFGAGVDFFILPEFSLHLSIINDLSRGVGNLFSISGVSVGNVDASTSILFFGASFHF